MGSPAAVHGRGAATRSPQGRCRGGLAVCRMSDALAIPLMILIFTFYMKETRV